MMFAAFKRHPSTAGMLALLTQTSFLLFAFSNKPAFADPPREMKAGLRFEQFEKEFDRQAARRYRLVDLSIFKVESRDLYAGIWEKREEPFWALRHGLKPMEFQKEADKLREMQLRLVYISGKGGGGREKYAGIFERKVDGPEHQYWLNMPAADFEKKQTELEGDGFRLIGFTGFELSGAVRYGGIWEKGEQPGLQIELGQSNARFRKSIRDLPKKGFRLRRVCAFVWKRQDRYACVWEESKNRKQEIRLRMTSKGLTKTDRQMSKRGFHPVQVSGCFLAGRVRYVAVWEKAGKE